MTWIKICGITNLEDAITAADAGADALGFVFYKRSPRCIPPELAGSVVARLPDRLEKVGVFVGGSPQDVVALAASSGMTAIQACLDVAPAAGEAESAYRFEQFARKAPRMKLIPVLSMRKHRPERSAMMWNPKVVHAFLLDSGSGPRPGGTGIPFDWAASVPALNVIRNLANIVVAGGLTPANVPDAIRILKPWGVDVSSGVEARPGMKDPEKVRAFIAAVRQADKTA